MAVRVLVVNGSPRGDKSATMTITNAFVEGLMQAEDIDVSRATVMDMNIKYCGGCMDCMTVLHGTCKFHDDDMDGFIAKYQQADIVIWSMSLMVHMAPAKVMLLIERLMPLSLPTIDTNDEGISTRARRFNEAHIRNVLIASSGFITVKHNFEPLLELFNLRFPGYERILFPGAPILNDLDDELREKLKDYLAAVRQAGTEFAHAGISAETNKRLAQPLISVEEYNRRANEQYREKNPTVVNSRNKWAD